MRTIAGPAALYWSTPWWMYMEPGEERRSEREAGRVGKTKNDVGVSYSFHYCKLNCSLSLKRKTHFKTIDNKDHFVLRYAWSKKKKILLHMLMNLCVATRIFQRVCSLISCKEWRERSYTGSYEMHWRTKCHQNVSSSTVCVSSFYFRCICFQ